MAQLVIDQAEAGKRPEVEAVPAWQWALRFGDLAPICPSRRRPDLTRRPGNALNVEIGQPFDRCMDQSPDGRGAVWLLSGGSILAYGHCEPARCPRALPTEPAK